MVHPTHFSFTQVFLRRLDTELYRKKLGIFAEKKNNSFSDGQETMVELINAKQICREPKKYIVGTPVGICCKLCLNDQHETDAFFGHWKEPDTDAFKKHFQKTHKFQDIKIKKSDKLPSYMKEEIRESRRKPISTFASKVEGTKRWQCMPCGRVWDSKKDLDRHLKTYKSQSDKPCSKAEIRQVECVLLDGGRYCPLDYFNERNKTGLDILREAGYHVDMVIDSSLLSTKEDVAQVLFPLLHVTDKMEQWPEVLYPLVLSKGNDFDKYVLEQLQEMHAPLPPDLNAVADMMCFCFDRLPFVLSSVPANVSEALVKFKQSSNPNEGTSAWSLTPHKS